MATTSVNRYLRGYSSSEDLQTAHSTRVGCRALMPVQLSPPVRPTEEDAGGVEEELHEEGDGILGTGRRTRLDVSTSDDLWWVVDPDPGDSYIGNILELRSFRLLWMCGVESPSSKAVCFCHLKRCKLLCE